MENLTEAFAELNSLNDKENEIIALQDLDEGKISLYEHMFAGTDTALKNIDKDGNVADNETGKKYNIYKIIKKHWKSVHGAINATMDSCKDNIEGIGCYADGPKNGPIEVYYVSMPDNNNPRQEVKIGYIDQNMRFIPEKKASKNYGYWQRAAQACVEYVLGEIAHDLVFSDYLHPFLTDYENRATVNESSDSTTETLIAEASSTSGKAFTADYVQKAAKNGTSYEEMFRLAVNTVVNKFKKYLEEQAQAGKLHVANNRDIPLKSVVYDGKLLKYLLDTYKLEPGWYNGDMKATFGEMQDSVNRKLAKDYDFVEPHIGISFAKNGVTFYGHLTPILSKMKGQKLAGPSGTTLIPDRPDPESKPRTPQEAAKDKAFDKWVRNR